MRATRPIKMFDSENTYQYSCVQHLEARALAGVWWHHSPNECIRGTGQTIHQRRMGCFFGHWDLVIYRPLEAMLMINDELKMHVIPEPHWFELKQPGGELSDNEQKFRGLLYTQGARHKVCRDLDTFLDQCIEWELIK